VIGPAYMTLLGWGDDRVETSSRTLRKLATEQGDHGRIYQAIWSLWTVDFLRGNLGPALEIAREALQIAEGARLPMLQLTAHHAVGYTHFYRGEYEEALHHATEGLPLFNLKLEKEIADKFEFSSSCALYCYQAEALQMLGRAAEADKSLRNLRALTEDLQHDHYNASVAYSLSMQCFFFHARDDVDEVRRLATEARKISRTEGFKLWVSVADIFLAWASARSGGNPVEALEKIRAAKTHYDATRTHLTELEISSMLAEVLLLAGRPEEVAPAVEAALRVTRLGGVRHYEPELFRFEAQAALQLGDRERARSLYRSAIDSANHAGAKTLAHRSTQALEQEAPP